METRDPKILDEIRTEFSQKRRKPFPRELRELALSALAGGFNASEIGQAAGISRQTVVTWKVRAGFRPTMPCPEASEAPVELKLIDRPPARNFRDEVLCSAAPMARIVLRSGVVVEVPAAMLDTKLVLALNEA